MRTIKQIKNLKNKTVLLRVDFNVPIINGRVADDFRIVKTLPTIKYLLHRGARKIILITHLGEDGKSSLKPVEEKFFTLSKIPKDKITFFENVRKFPGEEKNDLTFAQKLAEPGDIYVNEAFSVSHRAHASIVTLPKLLPAFAGLQFEAEVKNLSRAFQKPKHPFLFILGGAKFSTKMPLIEKYLKLADYVFVGGALANTFLQAKGYEVGKSLVDSADWQVGKLLNNRRLVLPTDFIKKDGIILDIGEVSIKNLTSLIKKSKLILWNGPLGRYEDGGAKATEKILKLVANSKAETIVGGGDTVALVSKLKMEKKFSFVSTGGGAALDFLVNGTLPGIKMLE